MPERKITCIICPIGCSITVKSDGEQITEIRGNTCKRGAAYAEAEISHPERTLTTTMRCDNGERVAVKTDRPIPKDKMMDCMKLINSRTVSLPVSIGDVLLTDAFGSNIVAAANKSKS